MPSKLTCNKCTSSFLSKQPKLFLRNNGITITLAAFCTIRTLTSKPVNEYLSDTCHPTEIAWFP